jgi:nucleoid-associated protein YgaU
MDAPRAEPATGSAKAPKPRVTRRRTRQPRLVTGPVSADDNSTELTTPPTTGLAGASTSRGIDHPHGFYVVRSGDSLWSIAARLLGDAASNARVAGEVNRLWRLNEHRIATGSPNLLMVGTRLRLR